MSSSNKDGASGTTPNAVEAYSPDMLPATPPEVSSSSSNNAAQMQKLGQQQQLQQGGDLSGLQQEVMFAAGLAAAEVVTDIEPDSFAAEETPSTPPSTLTSQQSELASTAGRTQQPERSSAALSQPIKQQTDATTASDYQVGQFAGDQDNASKGKIQGLENAQYGRQDYAVLQQPSSSQAQQFGSGAVTDQDQLSGPDQSSRQPGASGRESLQYAQDTSSEGSRAQRYEENPRGSSGNAAQSSQLTSSMVCSW